MKYAFIQSHLSEYPVECSGDKHAKRDRVGGQNRTTRDVERYPIFPRVYKNSCAFREPRLHADGLILQDAASLEVRHGIIIERDSGKVA